MFNLSLQSTPFKPMLISALGFVSSALLFSTGCVNAQTKPTRMEAVANPATGNDSILSLWSGPVKDRGTRFDMSFNFKNMTNDQSIAVPQSEITCRRGSSRGELKSTGKAKIETGVMLKPGQTRTFNLSCVMTVRSGGDYTVEIGKIFAANAKGAPTSNVLATNLGWHYVDADSPN